MKWYKMAKEETGKEVIIPESSKGGDCYAASGKYIMDYGLMHNNPNLFLVHGIVTGQGSIRGLEYGHAWVEDGNECIDVSQGKNVRMPKDIYYALGNIDPRQQIRYNPEQMRRKILDHGHWGPWDIKSQY